MEGLTEREAFVLERFVEKGTSLTVYLQNGYQLHGRICSYDAHVMVFDEGGRQDIIFRRFISTITPDRPLDLRMPKA